MTQLSQKLETRHLNMIALGGAIGTGIFLTSGLAIATAGPGGAVLGYAIMALIVYFLMMSLGEMSTYRPHSGTFCKYSADYVSPSFGFAMSYNYWFNWAITLAVEISAAVMFTQFWYPHASVTLLSALYFFGIFFANIFSVNIYGEVEYILSIVKVAAILLLIVLGLYLLGQKPELIHQNWTLGDAPFHSGFSGFITVFLFAGFAFQGTELVGVASGETKMPEKSIPRSIRLVFWRLCLFYIVATFIIGSLIPYTNTSLTSQSDVLVSPFTHIFALSGVPYAGSIINFVILSAVLSAGNSNLYSATRILWHMGQQGEAPRFFSRVSRKGVPFPALLATAFIGSMVFISSFVGNGVFFNYIVQVSSLSGFLAWFGIALSHYQFRKQYLAAGHKLSDLKFRAKFYPLAPIISMIILVLVIIGQMQSLFLTHSLNVHSFLITYISVIFFFILLIGHWIYGKMHI
jgi:lysine-specific permease